MDQTDVGLKAVVKALLDTVAPAVDPTDHLAKEQLKLATSYVDFVRKRLMMIHARERYELSHFARQARAFLNLPLPEDFPPLGPLRTALAAAEPLLASPSALTADIRQAALDLGFAVSGVVQEAHARAAAGAAEIDRIVLAASEEKLEFERLWYQPIGFDPSPHRGRSLEDYLK